ncbi:hypothetical protein ACIBF6_10140 [Streptosporangium amethystogenes]|uniref:hypothetical protein n=1 Tax=Streptosporangium amethystogenes TaxID=2002 RepID=UPI00379F005A
MHPVTLTSARVGLREFTPDDTDGLAAIYGDSAVVEHMSFEPRTHWTEPLHVPLPGAGERVLRLPELIDLVRRLDG